MFTRKASDDYTEVLMGTKDECGDTSDLDAVVIVHTAAGNFEHRQRFRQVYGDHNATWPFKLKVGTYAILDQRPIKNKKRQQR